MSVPLLAWPALHRTSKDPRTQKSDAVLVDLGLVTAAMFWLVAFLQVAF